MTIEPEPASTAGSTDGPGQLLRHFPARAVGSLSGLARLPQPVRRPPNRQWDSGVTILLPRLELLKDSPYDYRGPEHRRCRSALTLLELSLVLSAAGGVWSDPGLPDCLELAVSTFRVQGVAPACYRYLPLRHALVASMTAVKLRQHHGREPSAPEAAMTLTITTRPASGSESPVSPFTPGARLAASLITHAAVSAATMLGLNSDCCRGQHDVSYLVTFSLPSGPPSL